MANQRERRTRTLNIRIGEEEYRGLKGKADAVGLSVSALLRESADRLRIVSRKDQRETLRAVGSVCSSLRRLARWAEKHKGDFDALGVCLELRRVESRLRGIEAELIDRRELEAAP